MSPYGRARSPVRNDEKRADDVGGGFVEPHPREDPLADWEEPANEPAWCPAGVPTKGIGRLARRQLCLWPPP